MYVAAQSAYQLALTIAFYTGRVGEEIFPGELLNQNSRSSPRLLLTLSVVRTQKPIVRKRYLDGILWNVAPGIGES